MFANTIQLESLPTYSILYFLSCNYFMSSPYSLAITFVVKLKPLPIFLQPATTGNTALLAIEIVLSDTAATQ